MDPRSVIFGGVLVAKYENDVLRPLYGDLVGRLLKTCRSVHPMGPGWGDVWMWMCAWLSG